MTRLDTNPIKKNYRRKERKRELEKRLKKENTGRKTLLRIKTHTHTLNDICTR